MIAQPDSAERPLSCLRRHKEAPSLKSASPRDSGRASWHRLRSCSWPCNGRVCVSGLQALVNSPGAVVVDPTRVVSGLTGWHGFRATTVLV